MAAIAAMDQSVGRLLDLLAELKIDKRTAVIFLSDNGAGKKGNNGGLRGGKGDVWEGGVRVPCIVRVPGITPPGRQRDALLTGLEVAPTILALAGVAPPADLVMDGRDMTPVLSGGVAEVRDRMFWQRRDLQAARVGRWKWVSAAGAEQVFDLATDPGERADVSGQRPEKAAELRAAFHRWRAEMNAAPPRGPFRDY